MERFGYRRERKDVAFKGVTLGFCLMMAAPHLPTTHTHTSHTQSTDDHMEDEIQLTLRK